MKQQLKNNIAISKSQDPVTTDGSAYDGHNQRETQFAHENTYSAS